MAASSKRASLKLDVLRLRASTALPLPQEGSPKTPSSTSSSGGRRSQRDTPRCPACGNDSEARKLKFWLEEQAWVWQCSAERTGRDGMGATQCLYTFLEGETSTGGRRRACPRCSGQRDVEVHYKRCGYACARCQTFETAPGAVTV